MMHLVTKTHGYVDGKRVYCMASIFIIGPSKAGLIKGGRKGVILCN